MNVGAKVTLRGDRMFYFADKLMNIVLPRVRDLPAFTQQLTRQLFNRLEGAVDIPEINYDDVEKVRGMDIIFVTTAKTDEEAKELLNALGMPFAQA